ncbi:MAG: adenylate cyclase [Paracoccaceae bacterium]|jgi:adenylate cyclase
MTRRIRLTTGLILFVFVTGHLLNHALGLHSLAAMEAAREWFILIWRNPVGSAALMLSLLVHLLLAAWALYSRRSLRMSGGEAFQLVFGFSIPLLLALHFVGTGGSHRMFDTQDNYTYILLVQWKYSDTGVYWQTLGLFAAWIHGCIGLYYWLRLKHWFQALSPAFFAIAILLPAASWLGYYIGGKEVLALAEDGEWLRTALRTINPPTNDQVKIIYDTAFWIRVFVGALIGLALTGRMVRLLLERRRGMISIDYPNDRTVRTATGMNILAASNLHNIPHASVCGGRGRCSTCRVRIVSGEEGLSEPSAEELRVLERVGAPPNVRLACQAVPSQDISVVPLLPPNASVRESRRRSPDLAGQERDIAILFADLRSFTQFSEKKLPYDVVFVLNRYFAHMGEAVEASGGHLDKFIGDGVMALFGTKTDIRTGARQAMMAARQMAKNLANLNDQLKDELEEPLRIGIGIHVGPAIIGEMGYGTATGLTAIGDSVNTASRLEAMTKEFGAQLILSEDVTRAAEAVVTAYDEHEIAVRGRDEGVKVYVVKNADDLTIPD